MNDENNTINHTDEDDDATGSHEGSLFATPELSVHQDAIPLADPDASAMTIPTVLLAATNTSHDDDDDDDDDDSENSELTNYDDVLEILARIRRPAPALPPQEIGLTMNSVESNVSPTPTTTDPIEASNASHHDNGDDDDDDDDSENSELTNYDDVLEILARIRRPMAPKKQKL